LSYFRIILCGTVAAGLAACSATPKPKLFGTAPSMAPSVELAVGERLPMHIKVVQPQSSYLSVFYVVPGEGTQLLYPTDSSGSKLVPAGEQQLTTAFATRPSNDTTRLLRRPSRQPSTQQQPEGRGGGYGMMQDSFVLVYTSSDSLAYKTLTERVIGVTVPGYNDEAFNTVTKLIRGASTGNGAWSAIAVSAKP